MRRLLTLFIPMVVSAQIAVDTVIRIPTSFVINGHFIPELNKLYVLGWYEHVALDCSTFDILARIPVSCDKSYGYYSWNWRRQKLYICYNPGEDSVAVVDAAADTLVRKIPRVGDAGVYVGSTDRFYRPLAHIGLVGIDCATDTVVSTIPVPESGYGFVYPSWDSVGDRLWVSMTGWGLQAKVAVYDCATDSLLALIDVPGGAHRMNFDHTLRKAYFMSCDASHGYAGVTDTRSNTLIKLFPIYEATGPWDAVALDTIDHKAYIIGTDTLVRPRAQAVYVIDCATDSIIKEVILPRATWGVDFACWVPWSNRLYLTRRQASPHQDLGMIVVDCKTDSIIVPNLVLGYYPPFDFQIDGIRERVLAIGCESTSVHVLRDVEGGVAEEPASPGSALASGLQVQMTSDGFDVRYSVASPCGVDLSIYDLMGREVRRLVAEKQSAGQHSAVWDCKGRDGKSVARGVYFVRLDTPGFRSVQKAVVR